MQAKNTENPDAILKEYDEWHKQMKSSGETASPLEHPWYESVFREIQNYPACRVLEVGCGRGGFAMWLSKKMPQFRIVGLDFSLAAIEIARESAATQESSVEFVQGDAEALPFGDAQFDLIISCECMEHVPHPPQMAKEMARVLKPGGRFCLTTENYLNGMILGWLHSWLTGRPLDTGSGVQPRENFFFFWMIRRYLHEAGLNVTGMESSHYQWLLLPRVNPAKLCTEQFNNALLRCLAFPFGRHASFFGHKP
jgi:ubiquinone/menaquinone biosynthesis C-methylase UbiE